MINNANKRSEIPQAPYCYPCWLYARRRSIRAIGFLRAYVIYGPYNIRLFRELSLYSINGLRVALSMNADDGAEFY
jgi:hypothetical protein